MHDLKKSAQMSYTPFVKEDKILIIRSEQSPLNDKDTAKKENKGKKLGKKNIRLIISLILILIWPRDLQI